MSSVFQGHLHRAFTSLCLFISVFMGMQVLAQGVPNVAQTPGTLVAGPFAPQQGRTAVLVYHRGWLFTFPEVPSSSPVTINGSPATLDYQMRQWDISDFNNVTEMAQLGRTEHGFSAHGAMRTGNWVIFGSYQFHVDSFGGPLVEEAYTDSYITPYAKDDLMPPFSSVTYWSYDPIIGDAEYRFEDTVLARWDHLGLTGVIAQGAIMGNLLFMLSDQSNTGLAIYDMSLYLDGIDGNEPLVPPLLGVQTDGGFGGYWGDLFGMDGRLYAVASYRINGDGIRVVDVTDPSNPGNMVDIRFTETNSSSMYPQFQDHYVFSGSSKIDMRTQSVVLTLPTETAVHTVPGMGDGDGIDTSQYLLPVGNLVITGGQGGDARIQGMAIWAHQAEPDTAGPVVGYHIPTAGQANYPVEAPISMLIHETLDTSTLVNGDTFIVQPLGTSSPLSGSLFFSHAGMVTFKSDAPLATNTTYEVVLRQDGITDAVGNGIDEYRFNFSTGGSVGGNNPPVINSFTANPGSTGPGQNIAFTASATDPDTDTLEYRIAFGDGQTSDWQTGTSFNHTYNEEGHFKAMLQVRDPSGVTRSTLLTVTVANVPAGPLPRNSSTIAIDETARRVYKVNPDNGSVSVVNADTHALLREIETPGEPRGLALDSEGLLWVTAHRGDALYLLNPDTGVLVDTIDLDYGDAPFAILFSPDGNTAYVTLYGAGSLIRVNRGTRQVTGELPLGPTPRAMAISGSGDNIYITRFLSPQGHAEVWDVDRRNWNINDIIVLDTLIATDNTANGSGVANYLAGITIAPAGDIAWVSTLKTNTTKGMVYDGTLNDPDNTVRTELIPIDLSTNRTLADSERIDLDNSDSVQAVAFSPLGDYLFTVAQGNNSLLILDVFRFDSSQGLGSLVANLPTQSAPRGLVVDGTGEQVFVDNFLGRSISVYDISDLLETGDGSITPTTIDVTNDEALSDNVLNGKKTFYFAGDPRMSSEGYLSCATCHVDGGEDARVWDFNQRGEGLRNTIPLWGRSGMGHGNVHWTANFNEIQDFENDMRAHFGGDGFLSEADFEVAADPLGHHKQGYDETLDKLAEYVASLDATHIPRSPFRETNGDLTAEAIDGAAIFAEQGCDSCHNPAQQYTDRALHDVGSLRSGTSGSRRGDTLTGIETPTLLGSFASAPYFHDGSADTLEDVFSIAGGTWYDNEDATHNGHSPTLWPTQTWLGGTKSDLDVTGRSLVWNNVDGGSGGAAQLVFRYRNRFSNDPTMTLFVNGSSRSVTFARTDTLSAFDRVLLLVENVTLNAGTSNTIELRNNSGTRVSLDAMLVSNSDDLTKADVHRRVSNLSQSDQDALLVYLRSLDGQSAVEAGALERRFWTGIEGLGMGNLTNNARFPNSPDGSDVLSSLRVRGWSTSDAPGATANYGENYGQQIRGILTAPETGAYRFWVSGSDRVELYLSSDETATNASLIASVPDGTNELIWDTHSQQRSANVNLVSGQRYYFELLHKAATGNDHLALAWRLPGEASPSNGSEANLVPMSAVDPFLDSFEEVMPAAPGNLEAEGFSLTSINVTFTDGADNELGHTLQYRIPGQPWTSIELPGEDGDGTTINYVLDDLQAGSSYEIQVSTVNRVGRTDWLGPVSATTYAEGTSRILSFTGANPFRFPGQLNILQDPVVENDRLVLWKTDVNARQRGAIWLKNEIPIADFDTTFVLQASDVAVDSDPTRLSFVVQGRSPDEQASGENGGYDGLFEPKGGVFIVMGNSSVSGMLNDDFQTQWNMQNFGFRFNDGHRYRIRIVYVGGSTDELTLYLTNETTDTDYDVTWDIDLDGTIGSTGYVGFISDNVFNDQRMEMLEWTLESEAAAEASICDFDINSNQADYAPAGGSGTINVTATNNCDWAAVTEADWITITNGATGAGNGSVSYTVAENTEGLQRSAVISAAGQIFTVNQNGLGCNYNLNASTLDVPAEGQSGSITLTTADGCAWNALSNRDWIIIESSQNGSGSTTINYRIEANSEEAERSGTMTIGGQTVSITQDFCAVGDLSVKSQFFEMAGGSVPVGYSTGCTIGIQTDASWISLSAASATGDGSVTVTVPANNTNHARVGVVRVGTREFVVRQSGCNGPDFFDQLPNWGSLSLSDLILALPCP